MTLVVAIIDGSLISIAADTILTQHDIPFPVQFGTIKSCMLPGDICVSFSNSPDTARHAFDEYIFMYPEGTNIGDAINFFENSSEKTGNEYLIAFARPAKLVKIVEGKRIINGYKYQWIGDKSAYSKFREYLGRTKKRPENGRAINAVMFGDELANSSASDLYSAMRNFSLDRSSPTVGGFISVISNRGNGFRYSAYSDMLFDWPKTESETYDFRLEDPHHFQATNENAGYAIAQISPGFIGHNAVAFYYTKARKLFLFSGHNNSLPSQCTVFNDLIASEIYNVLNNAVGKDLKWLMLITSPRSVDVAQYEVSGISNPGSRFSFITEANTFPKS